ncbi:MAG: TetR family transcriptional regulator C-terminal domain-containing protein [Spirochaetaceae bacterium]|nr:TetR family transcriptional regulator C-terminal domain-containing protein [Spirochaetaceae bacterium]
MASFVRDSQKGITDPVEGLHRLISCSLEVASGNVVVGGCPVLNAAIESDDAFPALRVVAAEGAEWLRRRIRLLLLRASKRGRLRAGADIDTLSHFFLASIEGGIMLARLHGKASPLAAVVRTLHGAIDALSIDSTKSATAGNLD